MYVVVAGPGDIVVEHVADIRDVETARSHIGGRQQHDFAVAELVQRRHPRTLIHIAVQSAGIEAVLDQRLVQDRDIALAIAEYDRVANLLGADQFTQQLALGPVLAVRAKTELLCDRLRRRRRFRDLDPHGILEKGIDEPLDFRWHRGREEQRLAPRRQHLTDLLDVGNEAHIEHPVGLVDHQDLDAHQHDPATLQMIEQTAGRRNQYIDATIEFLDLFVHRHAADQQRGVEAVVDAVSVEALGALRSELACRGEDQRARHPGPGPACLEALDHRQHEGGGLAGTCLGDSENVAARHRDGDGLGLDRRGRGISGRYDGGLELWAERKLSEGGVLQKCTSPEHLVGASLRLAAGSLRTRVTAHGAHQLRAVAV